MEETSSELVATEILRLFLDVHVILKITCPHLTGMQEAKYRLLGILEREGRQSMSDLCLKMFISKPYMSRLVEAMVSEGLVERHTDANDRRALNITMTDEGRETLRLLFKNMRDNVIPYVSKIPASDLNKICQASREIHQMVSVFTDQTDNSAWSFYTSQNTRKE